MPKRTCPHTDRKIFSNGKCRPCAIIGYNKKRIEKLRTQPKKQIPKVNTTRGLLNKIYAILAAELKPLHTKCEAQLPGCLGKAAQIHHKRGRRGYWLIVSKYFGYQCDNCHKICTSDSKMAKELKLSMPINSNAEYEFTAREIELMEMFGAKLPKEYKCDNA